MILQQKEDQIDVVQMHQSEGLKITFIRCRADSEGERG